jgi:hypothetical protein
MYYSNNLLSNNSKASCSGYSDYWRQFEPKPKTSSGSYFGSGYSNSSYSGSSSSSYLASKSTSTSNSYHVPSFCTNNNSGLRVW